MEAVAAQQDDRLRGVARTALWTAASRAREHRRSDRLFTDPLADLLAGPAGAALLGHFHTTHAAADGNPFLPVRTRWFDDFLREAMAPGAQVVGLGAGLDTRAYRLDWPERTVLFEVDQPELLAYKEARLAGTGARQRCERRTVPVDLSDDWAGRLVEAGYDRNRPTVWFAEGLLFYLPDSLARAVVEGIAALSAPGTRLAADLIGTGVFRLAYMRQFLRRLDEAGSPWRFGTDDPGGFVESCGWRTDQVTEPGRPEADYGRWPERAAPVGFPGLPRSFLVAATLARAADTVSARSAPATTETSQKGDG